MILFQSFFLGLQSIWRSKLRSFLTILGVIIGVTGIVVLIGLAEGIKQSFSQQIESTGSNVLIVVPYDLGDSGTSFSPGSVGKSPITPEDVEALRVLPNVTTLAAIDIVGGVVRAGDRRSPNTMAMGVDPDLFSIRNVTIDQGRLLEATDQAPTSRSIVLSAKAKRALFPEEEALGKTVIVFQKEFSVVGLLKEVESTGGLFGDQGMDNAIYISKEAAWDITQSQDVFRVLISVDDPSRVAETKSLIQTTLNDRHGVKDTSVLTQEETLNLFSTIFDQLTVAVVAIAAISLLVSGIGIMNIMLVSVTERTQEIGIRKAVGAKSQHILLQFLIEAMLLSLLGGAIGLGLAYLGSVIIKEVSPLTVVITPMAVSLALGVSTVVGIVFGIIPAIKASQKNPIEALRYE